METESKQSAGNVSHSEITSRDGEYESVEVRNLPLFNFHFKADEEKPTDAGLQNFHLSEPIACTYNCADLKLEGQKIVGWYKNDMIYETFSFELKQNDDTVIELRVHCNLGIDSSEVSTITTWIKRSEDSLENIDLKGIGRDFFESMLAHLPDLVAKHVCDAVHAVEYSSGVSNGKMDLTAWEKVFTPLLEKYQYHKLSPGEWKKKYERTARRTD